MFCKYRPAKYELSPRLGCRYRNVRLFEPSRQCPTSGRGGTSLVYLLRRHLLCRRPGLRSLRCRKQFVGGVDVVLSMSSRKSTPFEIERALLILQNTYSQSGGLCTACPEGSTSAPGSSSCDCPAGTFSETSTKTCATCPDGSVSSSGSTECQPCNMGTAPDATRATCTPTSTR
jgi:hypothetical protein